MFSFLHRVTSSSQLSRSSVGSATKVRTAYRGRDRREGQREGEGIGGKVKEKGKG